MEITRLYNDVLMSIHLCVPNWEHGYTLTLVYCTASDTSSGSFLFRRWEPDSSGLSGSHRLMNGATAGTIWPVPMSPRRVVPSVHTDRHGLLRAAHLLAAR